MNWFIALDLLLLVLATARVTRLITTDSIGQWWLYAPLYKRVKTQKQMKYLEGLQCPYCVGFWVGVGALLTLWLAGGPGHAAEWWRWLTAAFALNYLIGYVSSKLD